ncbi:MAG: hypothetical protein WAR83_01455 [Flavobacteriales bacterium]|jgi:hypothetical protein
MIAHTNTWAQGDVAQGKLMLIVGAIVLLATLIVWKGVALGLILWSSAGFVVDNFLYHREAVHQKAIA